MTKLRLFLKIVLFLCFSYAVTNAFIQLLAQNTGTSVEYSSGGCSMPFLSICPLQLRQRHYTKFLKGQNMTLIDFYRETPSMASYFLKDESFIFDIDQQIQSLFDKVVLKEFVYTTFLEDRLVKCVTLDTLKIPPPDSISGSYPMQIFLTIDLTDATVIAVERHSFNEATLASFDYNADFITYLTPGTHKADLLKIHRRINLDLMGKRCDPENQQIKEVCINNFVMAQLECRLPWMPATEDIRTCDIPEDLDNFIDIINLIKTGKAENDLKSFGCLKPNCVTNEWYLMSRDSYPEFARNQSSTLTLEVTPSNCLKVTRQILLYGFSNFVADFGGYLGLLLGASLLSIYDNIFDFSISMKNRQNRKLLL